MPYATSVAGTTITASWANANVRDQVVTPFASAAARASAITAPLAGMLSYRTDAGWFEGYTGAAWVPVPGTVIVRGDRQSNSTTTTTEVGVLRIDNIPIISGQLYRIVTSPLALTSTVANDVVRAVIRTAVGSTATTASTQLDLAQLPVISTGFPGAVSLVAMYVAASTGTLSVLLSVSRQTGTGSVSIVAAATNPTDIWIEAAGTDPTDTGTDI